MTTSSVTGSGLDKAWQNIESYFNQIISNGFYESNRMLQDSKFLKTNFTALIINEIEGNKSLKKYLQNLELEIREGKTSSTLAVEKLYQAYLNAIKNN